MESTGSAASGEATGDAGAPGTASCDQIKDLPTEKLAARLLGVGVTDYASAEQAVDLGVRHLFIGSQTDKSILNGQGDPKRSLAELQRRAGEPLTVSVDEEGGLVQRLTSLIGELPSAQQMAQTMTPDQVRDMMRVHGEKMRALGITVDFAPDVDLAGGQEISDNAIGSRRRSRTTAAPMRRACCRRALLRCSSTSRATGTRRVIPTRVRSRPRRWIKWSRRT